MTIKAIVELHARRGKREQLIQALEELHKAQTNTPGFIGYERYEMVDDPEKLIEIVEWETREARQAWLEKSTGTGELNRVVAILRKSYTAITVRRIQ
jgi:heme-degrading monooxygenase HmoA